MSPFETLRKCQLNYKAFGNLSLNLTFCSWAEFIIEYWNFDYWTILSFIYITDYLCSPVKSFKCIICIIMDWNWSLLKFVRSFIKWSKHNCIFRSEIVLCKTMAPYLINQHKMVYIIVFISLIHIVRLVLTLFDRMLCLRYLISYTKPILGHGPPDKFAFRCKWVYKIKKLCRWIGGTL